MNNEGKKQLFLRQKETLETFLANGALTQAEFDKSYGDMVRLMGMEEFAKDNLKRAYFAGGCFWCITPIFKAYGADRVICGYCGGDEPDPSYEDVKAQRTGHRETICVEYYPNRISYEKLLGIYLANIDPYDEGGQYIDRGFSYTLAIYYSNNEEKETARNAVLALEKESGKKTAIALEALKTFYAAEEYHQDYYLKNPEAFEKELRDSGRKKEGTKPEQ